MASRSASMKRLVNALGKLSWGTTACAVFVVCAATAITLPAQVTTLFTFDGTHGASPYAGLVQATDGDLYGTTWGGGAKNAGTVFKITPAGILTTLYSFCSQTNCTDGAEAEAGLFQAANGDLYGTTFYGGSHNHGTVFRITPTGTLTTLYSFCSQSGCADGDLPLARLVQAANRNLYGTTTSGGTHDGGTVFKITPSGTLTTLYSFCSQSACTDGLQPVAGLVQLANGDFYGTTQYGGGHSSGTVFKITSSGTLTTLYSFCSQGSYPNCPDGAQPFAGLRQAADGDLYGTTQFGGANSYGGTVFKITSSGTLTTLYSFCSQSGCPDGTGPYPGLVQDTNGDFYGTTFSGGSAGDGTVFRLSVGLGPFVKMRPPFGEVGAAVKILGTNLTSATSVSFTGTAAVFTVVSPSLITTTVPAGASSGKVQVVTPSGTLSSIAVFRVMP